MSYIVTTGAAYTDMDAYACVVAYASAQRLVGVSAEAVLVGPLNATVPASLRLQPRPGRKPKVAVNPPRFALLDVSSPDHLPEFVDPDCVAEVFDHHLGHEEFWTAKIGNRARIERIGAAATLVWERILELGCEDRLPTQQLHLLAAAILSNTLGLDHGVARPRDREALRDLELRARLQPGWAVAYFAEVDAQVESGLVQALASDAKTLDLRDGSTVKCGQVEVRHAGNLIQRRGDTLLTWCEQHALIVLPSPTEGLTYLLTRNTVVQEALKLAWGLRFDNFQAVLPGIVQRKAIVPVLCGHI